MGYYGEEGLKLLSDIASKFGESFIAGYTIDKNKSVQEAKNEYHHIFNNVIPPYSDAILKWLSNNGLHFDKDEIEHVRNYISHFLTIYEMSDIHSSDRDEFISYVIKKLMGTLYGNKKYVDEAFDWIHEKIYTSFRSSRAAKAYEDNAFNKIRVTTLKNIFKAGLKRMTAPLVIAGSLLALVGAYKLYRKKKDEEEKERINREL
ncbi:MAG: hypothetical protein QXD03_02210 [Candidatus Anstonellales archaeon]